MTDSPAGKPPSTPVDVAAAAQRLTEWAEEFYAPGEDSWYDDVMLVARYVADGKGSLGRED